MKAPLLVLMAIFSLQLSAKTHEILMVNKSKTGETMVFEPSFLKLEKGDSVKFIPKDKGHSVESFKSGAPKGVADWRGGLNKEITVKFDAEGVHVFKCTPHYAMGMIGAVQVGKATNLEEIKKLKVTGKPVTNFNKIMAQIK